MEDTQNKNNKKQQEGICALCGKPRILSFEHIPPQCAFNNEPIFVQTYEHFTNQSSHLYGKKKMSQRGLGKQSLCISCNNKTGSWYGKAFCNFTKQGMNILNTKKPLTSSIIQGNYHIKPHNVLKQIMVMFLSADSMGEIRDLPGMSEYLLEKESMVFPDKIDIYIYSNASPHKRMLGYCTVANLLSTDNTYKWSEINYKPFGYFLTYDSPPPNKFMVKINDFSTVPYNKECTIELTTAYLEVENMIIGQYANL